MGAGQEGLLLWGIQLRLLLLALQLWHELCDLISQNPDKVQSLNVDAIIRGGLTRFTDQLGKLWCSLADYYIRSGHFEKVSGPGSRCGEGVIAPACGIQRTQAGMCGAANTGMSCWPARLPWGWLDPSPSWVGGLEPIKPGRPHLQSERDSCSFACEESGATQAPGVRVTPKKLVSLSMSLCLLVSGVARPGWGGAWGSDESLEGLAGVVGGLGEEGAEGSRAGAEGRLAKAREGRALRAKEGSHRPVVSGTEAGPALHFSPGRPQAEAHGRRPARRLWGQWPGQGRGMTSQGWVERWGPSCGGGQE